MCFVRIMRVYVDAVHEWVLVRARRKQLENGLFRLPQGTSLLPWYGVLIMNLFKNCMNRLRRTVSHAADFLDLQSQVNIKLRVLAFVVIVCSGGCARFSCCWGDGTPGQFLWEVCFGRTPKTFCSFCKKYMSQTYFPRCCCYTWIIRKYYEAREGIMELC